MQNKTIFLGSGKLNDTQFFIDVLYFGATSYSKSLYPTIDRYFKKYAMEYMGGGTYTSTCNTIAEDEKIEGYSTSGFYKIMRTIYTKK